MSKNKYEYWTEDQIAADKKRNAEVSSERRRQSRTPEGIESTNRKKRSGNMSFGLTKDGGIFILKMTTNSAAARLMLELLAQIGGEKIKRFKVSDQGHHQIEIAVANPKRMLELAGIKPVPEKCSKCDGGGAIGLDGRPTTSILTYCKPGEGPTRCPICKGSGRALSDPTEGSTDE